MQLGEDKWSKDTSRGGEILQYERVIALFPNRAGAIEIQPFIHELELWTHDGKRFDHELKSEPLSIEVTERPTSSDWWLPARRITVADRWSNAPDKLGTGEGALRVVTITVQGVLPEQIPPMPELGSAGAFVFPHPEVRDTRLYRTGPVTRVFWRWTVRPENPPSAYLKPIHIPYFDTKAREHREIVLAAQRIAMTEEAVAAYLAEADDESIAAMNEEVEGRDQSAPTLRGASAVAPLGLLAGFAVGLVALNPDMRLRRRRGFRQFLQRFRPDPDKLAFKRAIKSDDTAAARSAVVRLIHRGEGDGVQLRKVLLDLDRQVFGNPQRPANLKRFSESVRESLRSSRD